MTQTAHIVIVDPGVWQSRAGRLQPTPTADILPTFLSSTGHVRHGFYRNASEVDIDAVVILGSARSVYDDDKWIAPLKSWTISMIDSYVPVLGLCFGHQLVQILWAAK